MIAWDTTNLDLSDMAAMADDHYDTPINFLKDDVHAVVAEMNIHVVNGFDQDSLVDFECEQETGRLGHQRLDDEGVDSEVHEHEHERENDERAMDSDDNGLGMTDAEQLDLVNDLLHRLISPLLQVMQDRIIEAKARAEQQPVVVDVALGEFLLEETSDVLFDENGELKGSLNTKECNKLQTMYEKVGKQTFKKPHAPVDILVKIAKWLRDVHVKENTLLWSTFYKLLNRARSAASKKKRQDKLDAVDAQRLLVASLEKDARDLRILASRCMANILESLDDKHKICFMEHYLHCLSHVDEVIGEQHVILVHREQSLLDDDDDDAAAGAGFDEVIGEQHVILVHREQSLLDDDDDDAAAGAGAGAGANAAVTDEVPENVINVLVAQASTDDAAADWYEM
eukprot:CAMPEP_0184706512 /NCGR_PEP_ID=MMETSP0313-20130426/36795_1 /TAXON_ID=2792 /ORGANISM="Porphyridium aerugineum, Strain SAG 1380-2" /LENGTH=397 /DNA_ID=CAMNT_0027168065 /DNA_START=246 /DNA_END=1440 /DNA_ORIENTATION=-